MHRLLLLILSCEFRVVLARANHLNTRLALTFIHAGTTVCLEKRHTSRPITRPVSIVAQLDQIWVVFRDSVHPIDVCDCCRFLRMLLQKILSALAHCPLLHTDQSVAL